MKFCFNKSTFKKPHLSSKNTVHTYTHTNIRIRIQTKQKQKISSRENLIFEFKCNDINSIRSSVPYEWAFHINLHVHPRQLLSFFYIICFSAHSLRSTI